jgi:hypothetical protein
VNQALLAIESPEGPFATRALHHAYDAGQLLAAGVASLGAVKLGRRLAARSPRWARARSVPALALGGAAFVVSMFTVENDVTNAAARHGVPVWLAMLIVSLGVGVVLGGTTLARLVAPTWPRFSLAVVGVALAATNAFVLPNDYPAAHLMLAWLAALFVARGVEGVVPALDPKPLVRRAALGGLALFAVATLVVPPPQAVRRRMVSLSSSVVAPFALRFTPTRSRADPALLPDEVARSPWFRDRKNVPPVAPSRALALPEPAIVLFLTIDAVRADVLEKRRLVRELPVLGALKKEAAYFENARTPASSTRPSMASVFTGRYANQLRWGRRDGVSYLSDPGPRLAELLTRAGVATVSLPRLQRISSESGVGRGFQKEIRRTFPANEVVDRIIDFSKGFDRRTFVYAHFGEPHAPYHGKGTPKQRYLQEIGRVDKALGRLLRHLDDSGLSTRTLVVISADHGEAFFEHGVGNHATIVYEEVARIPLLVRGPGVVARQIDEPVTLLDITPTILDLFGLPAPGAFMGQSLSPLLAGKTQRLERPIAICSARGHEALYVPGGTMKVIFDDDRHTIETYDLASDAGERTNLVDRADPKVQTAVEIAKRFFDVHSRRGRERISD